MSQRRPTVQRLKGGHNVKTSTLVDNGSTATVAELIALDKVLRDAGLRTLPLVLPTTVKPDYAYVPDNTPIGLNRPIKGRRIA